MKKLINQNEWGKWIISAGLLVLGLVEIIAGISLALNVSPYYFLVTLSGVYLDLAIIQNQIIKNLRLPKLKKAPRD